MHAHNELTQAAMTPAQALQMLREGNERFRANLRANRDLLRQINQTRDGQWPFAVVLSCIDSRTSAELIFDQGLGDVFSVRVAGNVINDDVLGCMEFGCKVAGAKLIVVLGHSHCGAVKGACDDVQLEHLTGLLDKIKPAVQATAEPADPAARTSANTEFVQQVALGNVSHAVDAVRERSQVLAGMIALGEIGIVGAMYDVQSGAVEFLDVGLVPSCEAHQSAVADRDGARKA